MIYISKLRILKIKNFFLTKKMGSKASNSKKIKDKAIKTDNVKGNKFKKSSPNDPDVLVNLPAGLKYKVPGKRQRVIIGSIVIGLNILLVQSKILEFQYQKILEIH